MKKRFLIGLLVILTVIASLFVISCSGGGGGNETYTVTFDTSNSIQGKDAVPSQTVQSGGKVTEPDIELTRYNCVFIGWYNGSKKWDFAKDTVTSDITLKATFQGVAPPCDHNFVETERKDPTCEADGYYVLTCTKCRRFERYTKAEDPNMAKLEHIVQTERVEPSCGVDGYIRTYCDNGCGLNKKKTLDATGHHDYAVDENGDYIWQTVITPTKFVGGTRKRACTTCGLGVITEAVKFEATQTELLQLSIVNFKYTGGKYEDEPFVNISTYGRASVSSFYTSAKGNLINDGDVTTFWTADTYADGSDYTKDYFEIEWDKEYETGAIQLTVPYYTAWDLGEECYVSYKLSYWDSEQGKYVEYREFSDKEASKAGLSGEILITFPEPIVTKKFKAEVTHATRYAPATIYEINVFAKTEKKTRTPAKATGGAILSVSGKYSEWVRGADALPDGLVTTGWMTDARNNSGDEWAMYEYSKETFISNVQFTTKANPGRTFVVQFWIEDSSQPEGGRWLDVGGTLSVPKNATEAAKDSRIIRYGFDEMAFNGPNVKLGTDICTFNVPIEAKTKKVRLLIVQEPIYWEAFIHDFIPYTVEELADGEEKTELCPHTNARPVKVDYVDALGNQKQKDKIIAPTCTSAGYAVYQCQGGACSHIMTTNATDATGHHYGEYEVVNAATATTLGLKQSKCTECDAVRSLNYLEEYEAPTITDYYHNATGGWAQSFDDGNYMDTYEWVVPMLQKYNFKATTVMSITYGEGFVKEWTEYFSTGAFDLGSHSYNHGADYAYDPIHGNLIKEVVEAQYWFRSTFPGQKCIVFAAPLGQTSEGVADYLCGPMAANRNGGQTGVFMNQLNHLESRFTAGNVNSWISKADQTEGTYVLVDTKNSGKSYKAITEQRQAVDGNGNPKFDNGNPVMETVIVGYIVHSGSYKQSADGKTFAELQGTDGDSVLMPNQHGVPVYANKGVNYIYDAEAGTFVDKGINESGYRYDAETYQFILDSKAGYEIIETDTGKTVEVNGEEKPIVTISIEYKEGGTYKLVKSSVGSYEAYIDKIVESNAWTVECIHSLGSGSIYSSYDSTISKFDYLKIKGVWACSYNEIVQYRRQYSNSHVDLVEQTASRIEVSLTDTVDNVMFDHALTIKIDIPDEWTNVVVKQGDRVIEQVTMEEYKEDMTKVNCTIDGGYIYVDAYPDSDNITIELQ